MDDNVPLCSNVGAYFPARTAKAAKPAKPAKPAADETSYAAAVSATDDMQIDSIAMVAAVTRRRGRGPGRKRNEGHEGQNTLRMSEHPVDLVPDPPSSDEGETMDTSWWGDEFENHLKSNWIDTSSTTGLELEYVAGMYYVVRSLYLYIRSCVQLYCACGYLTHLCMRACVYFHSAKLLFVVVDGGVSSYCLAMSIAN